MAGIDIEVSPEENGVMIKEIIYGRCNLSRGLLRRMKSGGGVFLNEIPAFITQRVRTGDRLRIEFGDSPTEVTPEPLQLEVLLEDEYLLVVNKPAGLPVHPTGKITGGTLVNGLAHLWQKRGLASKIRLVHRLDRDTSGAILIAKEPYTYRGLGEQLRCNHLHRTYLAVVTGHLAETEGMIDQPIAIGVNSVGNPWKREVSPRGKPAKTHYKVVREMGGSSLVELRLETGRTHQIRVHLAWLGTPVVGDELYGELSSRIQRHALHSWSLRFVHPRSHQQIAVRARLPEDMQQLLQYEERRRSHRWR